MRTLELWDKYSREDVHGIFSPETRFTPRAGVWGLQGIARIPDRLGSFVFFVTFGRTQSEYEFDESITTDGVLTWQSQPQHTLTHKVIQELVTHDDRVNVIHLFLRTKTDMPYTYLGQLGYLAHDLSREEPVHFQWQLMDWPPPGPVLLELGVVPVRALPETPPVAPGQLEQDAPPTRLDPSAGNGAAFGRGGQPDHPDRAARNAALGLAGELLAIRREQDALTACGRADLAAEVVHVSVIEGDSAGYDIRSFNSDGSLRHIEVKTTTGSARAAFFISPNEVRFSSEHPNSYVLLRIYKYDKDLDGGRCYELSGAVEDSFALTATEFRAKLA